MWCLLSSVRTIRLNTFKRRVFLPVCESGVGDGGGSGGSGGGGGDGGGGGRDGIQSSRNRLLSFPRGENSRGAGKWESAVFEKGKNEWVLSEK